MRTADHRCTVLTVAMTSMLALVVPLVCPAGEPEHAVQILMHQDGLQGFWHEFTQVLPEEPMTALVEVGKDVAFDGNCTCAHTAKVKGTGFDDEWHDPVHTVKYEQPSAQCRDHYVASQCFPEETSAFAGGTFTVYQFGYWFLPTAIVEIPGAVYWTTHVGRVLPVTAGQKAHVTHLWLTPGHISPLAKVWDDDVSDDGVFAEQKPWFYVSPLPPPIMVQALGVASYTFCGTTPKQVAMVAPVFFP